ncbi:MAG TPA: hypothetical protein VFH85_07725 [Gammaproteobacteria bacterium]|nr:hypothetical protein [Gammaproteobacteria bacterium]
MAIDALPALSDRAQCAIGRRELRHERKFPPFNADVAERIVRLVAEGLPPSKVIEALPEYPGGRVVSIWRQTNPDFDAEMTAAAEEQADEYAHRQLEVAADVGRRADCRAVEVRALQWLAGKLSKRYAPRGAEGASVSVTHNTQINGDVTMTPEQAYRALLDG